MNNNVVSSEMKDCIEILSPELTFDRVLAINDVFRVPCSTNGNLDVILFTSGEPPLHFTIVEKDGLPFFIDNGSSNIFVNLEPGIYKFQIEDNFLFILFQIFVAKQICFWGSRKIAQAQNWFRKASLHFNIEPFGIHIKGSD